MSASRDLGLVACDEKYQQRKRMTYKRNHENSVAAWRKAQHGGISGSSISVVTNGE